MKVVVLTLLIVNSVDAAGYSSASVCHDINSALVLLCIQTHLLLLPCIVDEDAVFDLFNRKGSIRDLRPGYNQLCHFERNAAKANDIVDLEFQTLLRKVLKNKP